MYEWLTLKVSLIRSPLSQRSVPSLTPGCQAPALSLVQYRAALPSALLSLWQDKAGKERGDL